MYKAVFIDLDGTLLQSDHTVGDFTLQVLKKIIAKGMTVILVSARPLDAILPVSRLIGSTQYPIASLNGGYIVSGDEVIFKSAISLEDTTGLTTAIKTFGDTIIYYVEREWLSEVDDQWIAHEQKIMPDKIDVRPYDQIAAYLKSRNTGPSKLLVMNDAVTIAATEEHIRGLYPNLNIYTSQPTNLEVMNTDASKSNALKLLIDRLHIDKEDTIAIGDNYNDKEMIRFAGTGVAMGNAPQEIKDVADEVTDTNNNDGVGKILEKLIW